MPSALELFHPAVRDWFAGSFPAPTRAQELAWPHLLRGASTLVLAPTGSGKTLAAFLHAIERSMFAPEPSPAARCRVVYVSPLKALAVDVERNLRSPLVGIARAAATRGDAFRVPTIGVRTGDTPARERVKFARHPTDILITTPESLYLLLTSNARAALAAVETVIVDEIHALVPTKRGAHLALSLERLEGLAGRPLQRIGLSATQRPLEEVGRFLGGFAALAEQPTKPARRQRRATADAAPVGTARAQIDAEFSLPEHGAARPVELVDASEPKSLILRVEVPVEDMARLGETIDLPSGPAAQGPVRTSIWTAIHPRLLELIREHRSTLLFVNSRRVAERLAAALNELAGETMAYAHHGSVAREQRAEIEDRLKTGRIKALVATSSLELGIDMGAIDLVVQIEAPPSVASGLQRIGRSGHGVGETSRGLLFPKYRADLLACAAITRAMHEGAVERTRYPRNPLDVLAQQVVAMVAVEDWTVDALWHAVRGAAPFAELTRGAFEGVLDMLSGRYPSDELADLRPRITWDRIAGRLQARDGAKRVAIANGGTIPDRGLYGVFLATGEGDRRGGPRVGELDEEMVFESRVGETFLLGATAWRIEAITHDRVLVTPAPGEPGKMPFWKGENVGRPLELGLRIGRLTRELREMPAPAARERLARHHDLDERAADNLLAYLTDQAAASAGSGTGAGAVPDDRTVVIERCRDELGDWRICLLAPFGGRVFAPWAMAVAAKIRNETGLDVETLWTDDGFVVRFPETDVPPDANLLLPASADLETLLLGELGGTALFAARFREAAGRALLLPRRRPGARSPLWQTRKRAADLLAVAARFGSFPIVLEAYRECLRDLFDLPALLDTMRDVERRAIRVAVVDSMQPSPFAASLLFGFVANYLYDGDAPLAERRAQALQIDHAQLRELLGEVELRELLDRDAIAETEERLQRLEPRSRAKSDDGLHDLLLSLGDLSADELAARTVSPEVAQGIGRLRDARRAVAVRIAGEERTIAAEHAAQFREALGVALPPGLPAAFLTPPDEPLLGLVQRFARTHGPFAARRIAIRYALADAEVEALLQRLLLAGKVVQGAFLPGEVGLEWCAPDVLTAVRRRSLARVRRQTEPVEPAAFARFLTAWQGVTRPRRGLERVLDVVEQLAGAPLAASALDREILPARILDYRGEDLDTLAAAGEIVWLGKEPLGDRDGRIALYLTDQLPLLHTLSPMPKDLAPRARRLLEHLGRAGASFFAPLHEASGGGFARETVDALWDLVWLGLVTNDTFRALRAFVRGGDRAERSTRRGDDGRGFRSRRPQVAAPASVEGRWSLIEPRLVGGGDATTRATAQARALLGRYGLVSRGVAQAEALGGGFRPVYEVLRAMDDAGKVRRGYFAAGLGGLQFAMPAALDLLRTVRDSSDAASPPGALVLAATDPANPYGALLPWPALPGPPAADSESASGPAGAGRLARSTGAQVVLVDGALAGYLQRGGRTLWLFLPEDDAERARQEQALAAALAELGTRARIRRQPFLLEQIGGIAAAFHPFATVLEAHGFVRTSAGLQPRAVMPTPLRAEPVLDDEAAATSDDENAPDVDDRTR